MLARVRERWIRGGRFVASLASALGACMAGRAPGLWASSVEYVLAFDRTGVTELAEGGFETVTAEGRTVRLRRGYLVQSSLTLVDCLGVGGDAWDDLTAALFAPPVARAGHSEAGDPSEVVAPRFLDLARLDGDLVFGSAAMPDTRYCRVHQLVTGSYDASAIEGGVPEGVDPVLTTLVLEGEHRTEDEPWAPFAVRSTLASGVIHDLPDVLASGLDGSHAVVRVERDLARAFDGVDFDAEPARAVLRNLVIDAPVTVAVE